MNKLVMFIIFFSSCEFVLKKASGNTYAHSHTCTQKSFLHAMWLQLMEKDI